MEYKNNREHALALIRAGNATRVSIRETIGITRPALAGVFTQLRMMGYYPIEDPDTRVLEVVDKETYESRVAVLPSNKKTPEQKAETLVNTTLRADKAYTSAKRRHANVGSAETNLALQATEAVLKLAQYRALCNYLASERLADYFEKVKLERN